VDSRAGSGDAAHQRSSDLGFALVTFSSLKRLVDFFCWRSAGYGEARRCARHAYRRCELPANGILEVCICYLVTTFVGYWQHRLMHWRWFWCFHHSIDEEDVGLACAGLAQRTGRVRAASTSTDGDAPASVRAFAGWARQNHCLDSDLT
jgi:hypothetical protein